MAKTNQDKTGSNEDIRISTIYQNADQRILMNVYSGLMHLS